MPKTSFDKFFNLKGAPVKDEGSSEQERKIALLLDDLISLEGYVHDLFNFSPLPVSLVSSTGVVLEVNPSFEKITGYSFEEVVGEPLERIFESEKIEKITKKVLEEESVSGEEMRLFHKQGEVLNVQAFARARKNEKGATIGFFLGIFDLTEINKTQEQLKKSQSALLNILDDTDEARRRAEEERKKTEAIITNLSDGLLVFDKKERLAMINPSAEDFLNIASKKVIGKTFGQLEKLKEFDSLISLIKKRKVRGLFRQELEPREGLILEVSRLELKERREDLGFLLILHDITREKTVERLKTEFVSISAHQLRTPLSAIKWTLKMLLDGDLGKINKEQEEFLNRTYRSNERMIELVNSLLNVTRIEEGRFVYKPVLVDLVETVEALSEVYKNEAQKRGVKFLFRKPKKPLPPIWADPEKIKLAFQNLMENAVRYTPLGKKVEVSLRKYADKVQFKIKDEGIGIPEQQQKRLFTKFFRASNVMRLDTEGTGLGLFIAKNVVESHRGEIKFESKEDEGTTFWVNLPIAPENELSA